MARFVTEREIQALKSAAADGFQRRLYEALRGRAYRNTRVPGFVQPGDTQEWWHLCWERASDAAFAWHVERDFALGEWLRGVAFWLRDLDDTAWLGPWYRNHSRPLTASLETSHVCLALCEIIDLGGDLFTDDERATLEQALRDKGMLPCLRFCEHVRKARGDINNWYGVILTGFGACALLLSDDAATDALMRLVQDAYSLYETDSYGESLQYSNYVTLMLSHLNELILRLRPDLAASVDIGCYARLMDWYAASLLYMKPWNDETLYPRSVNFGDSAAVFRPTGDVLAQVAARCKETLPRQAALAAWLFETTYARPEEGSDELATFGFYNQFRYHAALMQPDMAQAQSPARAGLCEALTFDNGQILVRDGWENTRAALALQAGYRPLNVSAHRHQDLGSFQFTQGRERMIVDGGHCCYRLNAQKYSASVLQHATVDFFTEDECPAGWNQPVNPYAGVLGQKTPSGNFYHREPPLVENHMNRYVGGAYAIVMDMTKAYGGDVESARRAVVCALPHAVFVIDAARTARPMRMRAHFPMNNRDGRLATHRADDHRLVFRRGGEALKLFECACFVDGKALSSTLRMDWGFSHRNYHPLPGQDGQGLEGSIVTYTWQDADMGREHLRVCAIASDIEPRITGWHIKQDGQGNWYIESPEQEKLLVLRADASGAYRLQDGAETRLL